MDLQLKSMFASNNGIRIHYLETDTQSSLVPVLICPGLSETAEEYIDLMEYLLPRKCVVLSFRGRGLSDTPDRGYSLEDHVSDIISVVESAELYQFHLYSNSRGVSYALGFMENNHSRVRSLIVQDYPAHHLEMPDGWAEEYIYNYLSLFSRQQNIRPEAVRGIQEESKHIVFRFKFNKRILVLRGLQEDSLLDDRAAEEYMKLGSDVNFYNFAQSGHDVRSNEKESLYRVISDYISSC